MPLGIGQAHHSLHGSSLALASQVERYGLRTMSGSTGGVSVEATLKLTLASRVAATAVKAAAERIVDKQTADQV